MLSHYSRVSIAAHVPTREQNTKSQVQQDIGLERSTSCSLLQDPTARSTPQLATIFVSSTGHKVARAYPRSDFFTAPTVGTRKVPTRYRRSPSLPVWWMGRWILSRVAVSSHPPLSTERRFTMSCWIVMLHSSLPHGGAARSPKTNGHLGQRCLSRIHRHDEYDLTPSCNMFLPFPPRYPHRRQLIRPCIPMQGRYCCTGQDGVKGDHPLLG